jgi:AraC-like DNA-binding protein
MFLLGLVFFDNYLRNTGFYETYPGLWGITYCFPLLIAPLMYYYAVLVTMQVQRFDWRYLLLATPFVLFFGYYLATYYILPVQQKIEFFEKASRHPWGMVLAGEAFIIASGPVYAVLSLVRLHKHSKNIGKYFSFKEGISLHWLKTVSYLVILSDLIMLLTNLFSDFIPVITVETADNIMHASNVVLVFYVGFMAFRQKSIYNSANENSLQTIDKQLNKRETEISKYVKSGLKDAEAEKFFLLLIELIEKEELFLNGKLSLKDVADRLGISNNYLSQIINQKTGKNFFRFINEYRVEKAKQLLADKAGKYTILSIAYDCGFNSKSSFNTIFKEYTGKTPSEFLKPE